MYRTDVTGDPPFALCGPETPRFPVLISVPHGGRDYPLAMTQGCRLPLHNLQVLEDRHADALPQAAFAAGFQGVVAHAPRGWIDLNRDVREYDPGLVDAPPGLVAQTSRKVAGGLGVIPRRIGNGGDIWRTRISAEDFAARIEGVHRPYHAALEQRLAAIGAIFGTAILVDLHSMPPLRSAGGAAAANIVIGDLFGKSAERWVSLLAADTARDAGLSPALNAPYAGGYSVARHGRPGAGVHAIQIEICRALYLDRERTGPGAGLPAIRAFVLKLAQALADETQALPLAAE